MSRAARLALFSFGVAALGALVVACLVNLPAFGGDHHPYRTLAVLAALAHHTANTVSAVTFDLRGVDTFGEECILLASVIAAGLLLRPGEDETASTPLSPMPRLDATRVVGYLLLAPTAIVGLDVIAHGALTPGGGFQGGVVVGTGLHLVYVAGRYDALERLRPLTVAEWGEALGAGAYACIGVAGIVTSGAFLANFLPHGALGSLFSTGTVALLSGAVGIEVASGVAVLLARFLRQAVFLSEDGGGEGDAGPEEGSAA